MHRIIFLAHSCMHSIQMKTWCWTSIVKNILLRFYWETKRLESEAEVQQQTYNGIIGSPKHQAQVQRTPKSLNFERTGGGSNLGWRFMRAVTCFSNRDSMKLNLSQKLGTTGNSGGRHIWRSVDFFGQFFDLGLEARLHAIENLNVSEIRMTINKTNLS